MFLNHLGGHFTGFANYGETPLTYVREKDMPSWLGKSAVGLIASDNWGEFSADVRALIPFVELSSISVNFVLAIPRNPLSKEKYEHYRIATSYPDLARSALEYFGIDGEITLVLGGGVEAAPYARPDMVNAIIDVCESGRSLEDNELVVVKDHIWPVSLGYICCAETI